MENNIAFIAQIDSIRNTKDGGFKVTLECGGDALEAINKLMAITIDTERLVAIVIQSVADDSC